MTKISTIIFASLIVVLLVAGTACRSKSNQRAVKADDLEKAMQDDAANAPAAPNRSTLKVDELIQASECGDIACMQLYLKEKGTDFFYAKKGEAASLNRGAVVDSAGNELVMPLSTIYFTSDPGADWRVAHTVHRKELSDALLNEFDSKGFSLVDSFYYHATKAKCYRYTSAQYPGEVLYYSPTYTPWYFKGLYNKPTWVCYVFEIHSARQ
jgi:hypothetical protein